MNDYSNYIGKLLDKRYRILEVVGMGGMAVVLRAEDTVMNRIVAIKILNDEYNGNEQAEARFIDESKAVAMLSHKNIVNVFDVAIYPDIKYIVMEYVDGITLREYLDKQGVLPWNEACIYVLQILRALEHAHGKGVIHRDIKPQNIILQKNGDIKVMDFGIAKIPTNDEPGTDQEKAVGTVYYISPEQASGKQTGAWSDLYSVGILLYECVTGVLPFVADTPAAVAAMQVNNEPQNPRDLMLSVPVAVSQIILKAMMKDPADRFRSAHSMGKAIEWVLRNPDVIFALTEADTAAIGETNVVSIDMIDTAEIKPYEDDEIEKTLGQKLSEWRARNGRKDPDAVRSSSGDAGDPAKTKKKKRKKGKHSGTMFPIILGIAIPFLIVAVVLAILLGVTFMKNMGFTDSAVWDMQPFKTMYSIYTTFFHNEGFDQVVQEEATFPNLVGMNYDEGLVSRLQNGTYGFRFEIREDAVTYTHNPSYEDGQIIYTEPGANAIRKGVKKNGKTVYTFTAILVNRIQTTSTIPDVIGFTKSDARVTMMNKYKIPGDCISFEDETDPLYNNLFDGQVTRTVPAAGETYHKGDQVVLYICKRPESAITGKMPELTGMEVNYAIRLCEYNLYRVEIVDFPVVGGDNTVREQSIPAGTVSDRNTPVVLTVSRPMNSMPYLYYTPLSEATALLNEMGIPYTVEVWGGVYKEDNAVSTRDTDYDEQIDILRRIGGHPTDEIREDTVIIFQSIAAGTPPETDGPVVLIAATFDEFIF